MDYLKLTGYIGVIAIGCVMPSILIYLKTVLVLRFLWLSLRKAI